MRRYARGLTGLVLILSVFALVAKAANPTMPWYMPVAYVGSCLALVLGVLLLVSAITES